MSRAICLVFGLLVSMLGEARANTIVIMTGSERADELHAALEVALAGRRVTVASLPPPDGVLRLDRAAAAQRAALDAHAQAALWIDVGPQAIDVCVVSADGRHFRHAPISSTDSARVFAAIATSLLDELLAPPEGPLAIDVNVSVNVGPAVAPMPAAPVVDSGASGAIMAIAPARPIRWDRTIVEVGPMASPLSVGIEGAILFPVSPRWRFGAVAGANVLLFEDDMETLVFGAVEARRVGRGSRHFDLGVLAGAATAMGDPVGLFGLRLNFAWEGPKRSTALTLAPVAILTGTSDAVVPGVWASLRWGIPI